MGAGGRGEGTWARVVPGKWPLGEPPPADTPPCEGCKKKKKNLFCLFVSPPLCPPHGPPDCLRVGCAPSKWLPFFCRAPRGLGRWTLGSGEGWWREEKPLLLACGGVGHGCGEGSWSGADGECGCGGQNRPKEAKLGRVGGWSEVSMLTGSGKREARKPRHLKSSRGWSKDLVAAGRPTSLCGGRKGAGEGQGYSAASPGLATRGRARPTGKEMRA